MSYGEPPLTASGPPRAIAWTLIALGAVSYLSLAWLQVTITPASWLGSLLFFLAFGVLEAGAVWAAIKNSYGMSIALGGFVGLVLGAGALSLLIFGFGGL